jgi:VWFA-related protein
VLRINTTLLQVDAIVRDEKGQAITDLRAEDFVIVENGRTYPVEYCSYINLVSERPRTAAPTDGRLSENELGRAIAFIITRPIIDANVVLTTPGGDIRSGSASNRSIAATDANTVRRLLHQFVDHQIGARDLVAIHSTERDLGVLANFTTDRDALRAAIEHATKPVPAASWVRVMVTNDGISGTLVDQNLAVLQTLSDAIEQVQALPGRKLVVLVSRGFVIHPRLTGSEQVRDRLRELTAQANRAGIAIYTLNPRGLGLTSGTLQDMDSLIALSQETGGRSVYNTNDLSIGFSEILKENEGYYLLGYQLADDEPNAPHKIKVQVKRPKLKAQSRQTIYSATRLFKPGETNLNVALNTPFALRDLLFVMPGQAAVHVVGRAGHVIGVIRREKNGHGREGEEEKDDDLVGKKPDHCGGDKSRDDARDVNLQVFLKRELRRGVAISPGRELPRFFQHVQREGKWEEPYSLTKRETS